MSVDISVIGLGKLGASLLGAAALRGFDVIGFDINQENIRAIDEGRAPVWETDLDNIITENRARIRIARNASTAVTHSHMTFVVVPTPSTENGAFSLENVVSAFGEIGKGLREKSGDHVVVLNSTVLPGSIRTVLVPVLEESSGKKCGRDFGFCYNPLFIALGSIVKDLLNPNLVLIGESDDNAGSTLEDFQSRLVTNNAQVRRMNFENAELTKIALNTFVTTKITFANMLAELCDRLPGGDVDIVSDAIGLDPRVGRQYLTGGLGYGGPCFPRDNKAMAFIAGALGVDSALPETVDTWNRTLPRRLIPGLTANFSPGDKVAVLGLAYKPDSDCAEEAQGIYLANELSQAGAIVVGYDPLACKMAAAQVDDGVTIVESLEQCVSEAGMLLITTPDPVFENIEIDWLTRTSPPIIVVDFWRHFADKFSNLANVNYIPYGRNLESDDSAATMEKIWGPEKTKHFPLW